MSATGEPAASPDPVLPVGTAVGTWAVAWILGSLVAAPIALVAVGADLDGELGVGTLAVAAIASWSVSVAVVVVATRRYGTGNLLADLALRLAVRDGWGVPIGVAAQLGLIPLLYVPLRAVWPDTFTDERLAERAQDLVDAASGARMIALVLIVVVGAPVVEELLYRGVLQRSIGRALGPVAGLAIVSLWFALVHPSPVEYPGLLVAGLVFGATLLATGRLGTAIVTHAAFNATGLVVAVLQ